MLIIWSIGAYVDVSAVAVFFCKTTPTWGLFSGKDDDFFGPIFCFVVMTALVTAFTLIFLFFSGVRYRIYIDRIEYQRGKFYSRLGIFRVGATQTISFDQLISIFWNVNERGDEGPSDTTFLEFRFTARTFQLHKTYSLSSQVAEACKTIEKNVIAPRILEQIEAGEAVTLVRRDKSQSRDIVVDKKGFRDRNQRQFAWDEITMIHVTKGKESVSCNFVPQSHIQMESISGENIDFDMPQHNPYACWAVLMRYTRAPVQKVSSRWNTPDLSLDFA